MREAEANCKQRQTDAVRAVEDRDEELGGYLRYFEREQEEQRELEPPDDLAEDWERYLDLMEESVKHERAAFSFDASEFNEQSVATAKARRAGAQARQLAKDMGLPTCGEAIY